MHLLKDTRPFNDRHQTPVASTNTNTSDQSLILHLQLLYLCQRLANVSTSRVAGSQLSLTLAVHLDSGPLCVATVATTLKRSMCSTAFLNSAAQMKKLLSTNCADAQLVVEKSRCVVANPTCCQSQAGLAVQMYQKQVAWRLVAQSRW
jgi:hypothetical protein